jgi:DNA-binding MarR family transcriptional regulator
MNTNLVRHAALLIRIAQRKNQVALDSALATHGTTTAQWAALSGISFQPGSSAHDLALRAMQTDQSIGTLITPLVERGLVERTRQGNRLLHDLTDRGRSLLAACEPTVRSTLEERMGTLNEEQLEQLCDLLEQVTSDGPAVLFPRASRAASSG